MGLFQQNVIAVLWDFDKTLVPGNMQDPFLLKHRINPNEFWLEVNGLKKRYAEQGIRLAPGGAHLNHLLTYAQLGKIPDLTNQALREAGSLVDFYPGMPQFMGSLREMIHNDPRYSRHEVRVEHYIVSTGIKEIIAGSAVAGHVDGIWASEFIERPYQPGPQQELGADPHPITQIAYLLDDTSKTRAVYEINKGVNENDAIDINGVMPDEDRRVPIQNMICIGDGPSDVPMFSVVNQYGGKSFAVYNSTSEAHFSEVAKLREQNRVIATFTADYSDGSEADRWLRRAVRQTADAIVLSRERRVSEVTTPGPGHVVEEMPDRSAESPDVDGVEHGTAS